MIAVISTVSACRSSRGASTSIAEPYDLAALYPPLLARGIELCRRFRLPEHLAEDFVQEAWSRSFRRLAALNPQPNRQQALRYMRLRLLGLFKNRERRDLRHLWRYHEEYLDTES